MSAGRWLRRTVESGAWCRLLCLPHAGGTMGAFQPWRACLPAGVELVSVQYPGRQDRLDEPHAGSIEAMASGVHAALHELDDLPTVLFGHSMGSAVAYELAHRENQVGRTPLLVLASARGAPHRVHGEHRHHLDDQALSQDMIGIGGPGAQAFAHESLRQVVLPPLRADLRALDTYRPARARPLGCPILPLRGRDDERCTGAELETWHDVTATVLPPLELPGGHHYFLDHPDVALEAISSVVRRAVERDRPEQAPPVPPLGAHP